MEKLQQRHEKLEKTLDSMANGQKELVSMLLSGNV